MTSGCTCAAVYMVGSKLYVANAGDSRVVMAVDENGTIKAKNLSRDHKPDDPEEEARIRQWGGFVSPAPEPGLTARVYLDPEFTMIGLAMSRSIGKICCIPYMRTHNVKVDTFRIFRVPRFAHKPCIVNPQLFL
jgi:serine/threonine protein phosphatase PrpC